MIGSTSVTSFTEQTSILLPTFEVPGVSGPDTKRRQCSTFFEISRGGQEVWCGRVGRVSMLD